MREETTLDAPADWVRQRLQARLTADGLHAESAASFEQEHTLLVRAGVPGLSKTVAMLTLPAYQRGEVTVTPFRWVATGPLGELFPTLEANLELEPTDDGRTRVVLSGPTNPRYSAWACASTDSCCTPSPPPPSTAFSPRSPPACSPQPRSKPAPATGLGRHASGNRLNVRRRRGRLPTQTMINSKDRQFAPDPRALEVAVPLSDQ